MNLKYLRHAVGGLACAVALAFGGGAQATVVTFDNPALVDVDPNTGNATYREGGFSFQGAAATFLPLDGVGTGGTPALYVLGGSPLVLTATGGGLFSLAAFDYARDIFDPTASGTLTVQGLFGNGSLLERMLVLGDLTTALFPSPDWSGLTQVTLVADRSFVLDSLDATRIPEPASLALVGLGLGLAAVAVRRRRRATVPAA